MADTFPASGNIEPVAFPHLLVDLHRHGATGSLKVTGTSHPKALYFRSGRILFGSSNDPQDQLGAILIEAGKITPAQLDEVNAKVGPGNPLAKLLAESGFVNQRELADAARSKVERILADVLSWESGSFEFEDGVLPKGAVDLKLSTERLLVSAVQRIADRSFALRHVDLESVLEPVGEAGGTLAEVRTEVLPLFERLDGERSLRDAIAQTRLDEFEGAKLACAMLFLGIVRKSGRSGQEVDLAEEAQSGFEPQAGPAPSPLPSPASAASPEQGAEIGFGPTDASEPVGFAFAEEKSEEPAVWAGSAPEPPSPAETVALPYSTAEPEVEPIPEPNVVPEPEPEPPPSVMPEAPSFDMEPPPRPEADTVPGDQPAYVPDTRWQPPAPEESAPEAPPTPIVPHAPQAPPSRPSPEDLAALDALLKPGASTRLTRPVEKPRQEKWEPQFRPPTTPPRRTPAAVPSGPSRAPLVAAAAGVVLATVAAWYFLLRSPTPPPTAPRAASSPPHTLAPPVTVARAPAPAMSPAATPAIATPPPRPVPTQAAATPLPAPAAKVSAATPTLRPTPSVAPPSPRAAAGAGAASGGVVASAAAARALLRQGSLAESARGFVAALAPDARGRFSLQLLTACAPDTVEKAVKAVAGDELFILPVNFKGRECYRLCWGVYPSRAEAEAAAGQVPAYFHQGGAPPRLQPLAELLP
jgi:hypothetical protein